VGANATGLDAYDVASGHVTLHVPLVEPHELSFYEDGAGSFWVLYASGDGLALLDRQKRRLTLFSWSPVAAPALALTGAISMLEDRAGNLWIGTLSDGILRFERDARRLCATATTHRIPRAWLKIALPLCTRTAKAISGPASVQVSLRSSVRILPYFATCLSTPVIGPTWVRLWSIPYMKITAESSGPDHRALNRFDPSSRIHQHTKCPVMVSRAMCYPSSRMMKAIVDRDIRTGAVSLRQGYRSVTRVPAF